MITTKGKKMISSYALEAKVAPKGVACTVAPSGWHRGNGEGVCAWCSQATR